jgi:transcriptional regulator with XRE-family HTH domain
MSPISIALFELRDEHELRQAELAELLGYEQSYVSALETGTKGPPPPEFVARLIATLRLDDRWQARLWDALEFSQRKIVLATEAHESIYRLCNELRKQLDHLHPAQVQLMHIALNLPQSLAVDALPSPRRSRRRCINQKEATEM